MKDKCKSSAMITYQNILFCQNVFQLTLIVNWACILQTDDWLLDAKNLPESDPELPGHDAVEDEVDHAVGEDQHVHQLP